MVSFHTIPDIELNDQNIAGNLESFWIKFKSDKKDNSKTTDNNTNINLPKLKGATSWISFRGAFTHKL